jgi:uncharacterized protein (TIGR02646 family)
MIHLSRKAQIPVPKILQNKGQSAAEALKQRYQQGERDFGAEDFNSSIYGHETVKVALKDAQYGKCCYCEAQFDHAAHGDVEHFRPKAGWVQGSERLNKPGYYWLAYDWDNLLFSCQICNQSHKRNRFPLSVPGGRAISHHDAVNDETPLFIHPAIEHPAEFIHFKEEMPVAVNGNERGKVTIEGLGLDREPLNEKRRTVLNQVALLYDLAKGIPDTMLDIKSKATKELLRLFEKARSGEAEFSAMLHTFFINNPLDFLS